MGQPSHHNRRNMPSHATATRRVWVGCTKPNTSLFGFGFRTNPDCTPHWAKSQTATTVQSAQPPYRSRLPMPQTWLTGKGVPGARGSAPWDRPDHYCIP